MTETQAVHRLERLEGYLREDPDNTALLADAFDAALAIREWARAEFHLRHGQAIRPDDPAWNLREVHWLLAQHRWDEAEQVIRNLQAVGPAALQAVLIHDLAYVAFRQGNHAQARETLAPWLGSLAPSDVLDPATQVLWVRVLHRLVRHDEAMAWAKARAQAGALAPQAAGAASLLALDASDYVSARQWSEEALKHDSEQMEALVARASLALADRDAPLARKLLAVALRLNPEDGRAWSALAFAHLLEQRLDLARADFERAVQYMPNHIGTWHGLGWTAILQKDLPSAHRAFEVALALDRNFAESHGGLAVVLAMVGRRSEAQSSIDRAGRLDRLNLSARYAQALLDGDASDAQALRRLASRLLANRATPLGGSMSDLLGGDDTDSSIG